MTPKRGAIVNASTRAYFDRIAERMNASSGAYGFMVFIDPYRLELIKGVPHHLCPAPSKCDQRLRSLVVPDDKSAAQVRMIFADDGLADEGRSLSKWDEHTWRASYGEWDWERVSPPRLFTESGVVP